MARARRDYGSASGLDPLRTYSTTCVTAPPIRPDSASSPVGRQLPASKAVYPTSTTASAGLRLAAGCPPSTGERQMTVTSGLRLARSPAPPGAPSGSARSALLRVRDLTWRGFGRIPSCLPRLLPPRPSMAFAPSSAAPSTTATDPGHDAARQAVPGGIDRRPFPIVRVADAADIAQVLRVARETGLRLAGTQRRPQRYRRRPRRAGDRPARPRRARDRRRGPDRVGRWADGCRVHDQGRRARSRVPGSATPARSASAG